MDEYKEQQQKLNGNNNNNAQTVIPMTPSEDNINDKTKHISEDSSNGTMLEDDALVIDFDESKWLPCCHIKYLSLSVATVIGALIGGVIGVIITLNVTLSDDWQKIILFPGNLWVRALKLLVLPLIILMMIILPSRVEQIGSIGARCIPLYLLTSTCASIQGSIWVWIIEPGSHGKPPNVPQKSLPSSNISELDAFLNVFYNAVPSNIVTAMSDLTILGIIIFFLTFGILLRRINPIQKETILNLSKGCLKCVMLAVVWVIWFTPIGMCSLVCNKIASTKDLPSLLQALGFYLLCVLIGHSIHVFVFYPLLFWITTRLNGWKFFSQIYQAPLLALATSSSAATLPRSIVVAENAGIRKEIYQFILPLGAAINMDGTALGFPIMIGLIAQLYNVKIAIAKIVLVSILSVVVSVGTAPVPNAGMVYLLMLLSAAGLQNYEKEAIATLFILDWFVDRIETAVNVTSDQYVAKICDVMDNNSSKKDIGVCCGCCYNTNKQNNHNNNNNNGNMTQMAAVDM